MMIMAYFHLFLENNKNIFLFSHVVLDTGQDQEQLDFKNAILKVCYSQPEN